MKKKLLLLAPLMVLCLAAMAFKVFSQEKVNTKVFAYVNNQGITLVLQGTKGTCTEGARALLLLPEDIVLGCWTMVDQQTVRATFEDGTEVDVPTAVFKIMNKDAPKNFGV